MKTRAEREEARDLRESLEEIRDDLTSAAEEYRETREQALRDLAKIKNRIEGLKDQREWRKRAIEHLKTK